MYAISNESSDSQARDIGGQPLQRLADYFSLGMLVGKLLRSPHPHAIIRSIDTSRAEAAPGVKAVVTRVDFTEQESKDHHNVLDHLIAGDKTLYDGHAVAAVVAASESAAPRALDLIKVDYQPLPYVMDVDKAMLQEAPVLHEGMADESVPTGTPGNVVGRQSLASPTTACIRGGWDSMPSPTDRV